MRIAWTAEATANLAVVRRYIAKDNSEAARRIVSRIGKAVEQLAKVQGMGRPGRVTGTRELVVAGTQYIVPYRVRGETVEVLAVLHGAQNWPKDFKG
jgi:toxin ParE1/3/4